MAITSRWIAPPRGLTLVELVVAVAIIALLTALAVPAVMDSRRAADRLRCASNLRQIGQATLAYHDLFNAYPAYFNSWSPTPGQPTSRHYSIFGAIAPQLELGALYNHINFHVGLGDEVTLLQGSRSDLNFGSSANTTAMGTAISFFFCPSDPTVSGTSTCRGTNYRANWGTAPGYRGDRSSGPFTVFGPVSAAGVTDGLSHTAAYSEKPRGDAGRSSFAPFVDPLIDPPNVDPPASVVFEFCDRQPIVPANYRTTTGINWLVGGLSQTCYNHMDVPNGNAPDCLRLGNYPALARATARSYHGVGANVAMADGSVRFVTALKTWEAVGTRAGGESMRDDW